MFSIHNQKIAHRDINPRLLFVKGNQFYLADFGSSVAAAEGQLTGGDTFSFNDSLAGLAKYGSPAKKLQYIQGKTGEFQHDLYKSDLYSVGLVILETILRNKGLNDDLVNQILINI